jgi:hypothetical protein
MKIFSMFTKDGRVDVPLKDNQAGEAAQIMQNPEMSLMDKVREMTDLSNKLTKAQLHDLESKIEKVAFTDINGQTITLIKDAGNAIQAIGKEETAPEHTPEELAEFEKEKAEHPEFSDEQVWQIISDHAVEKGGPGSGPHAVGDSVRITGSNRHAGKTGKVLRHDPKFNSTIVDVGEYESATVHPNDLESTEKSTQKSLDVLRNSAGKLQKGGPGSGRHYEGGPKDKPASGYTPVEGQINHKEYPEKLKSKTDAELNFIIRDAHEAIKANPEGKKSGYYADEINYAGMELSRRAKDQSRNAIGKPAGKSSHESRVQDITRHYRNNPNLDTGISNVRTVAVDFPWAQVGHKEHIGSVDTESAVNEAHARLHKPLGFGPHDPGDANSASSEAGH